LHQYIGLCYPDLHPFEGMSLVALRIYGLLTDDQRRALSQGYKLSLNELSTQQQAALYEEAQNPSLMIGGPGNGFYGASHDDGISDMMNDGFDQGEAIWSSYTQPTRSPEDVPSQTPTDESDDFFYEKPLDWNYSEIVGMDPAATLTITIAKAEGDEICERDLPKISPDGDGTDFGRRQAQQWISARSVASELAQPSGDTISYASCPTACLQIQVGVANKFTVIENVIEHRKGMTAFGPVAALPERIRIQIQKEAKKLQAMPQGDPGTEPLPTPDQKPPPPEHHD